MFAQPNGRALDPRADHDEWEALLRAAGLISIVHDRNHGHQRRQVREDQVLRGGNPYGYAVEDGHPGQSFDVVAGR